MSEKAVRVLISGRVQGVWFRGWARQQATHLGLSGWVRNLIDGRVEAVVAGPAEDVDRLVELFWKGPPAARISDVQASPIEAPVEPGFHQRPTG